MPLYTSRYESIVHRQTATLVNVLSIGKSQPSKRTSEFGEENVASFIVHPDGATQFAQSCGGGGASSDLPWGRNPDEDDRRFAYRCMMQAHKILKPALPKRGMSGRR